MLDKAAEPDVPSLWRFLLWTALLLEILLAIVVVDTLWPGAPAADHGAAVSAAGAVASKAGAAPEAAGVTAAPLPQAGAAPGADRPTWSSWPATLTPRTPTVTATQPAAPSPSPSPPASGSLASGAAPPRERVARADAEAQLGLAGQARWQRPRATPTCLPTPTAPPPTSTSPPPPAVSAPTPSRIVAPTIGLDARIVAVKWQELRVGGRVEASWVVPKNNVGWHATSALPGQPGNTVLNGHRNIYAQVFRYVVNLKPGDPITIHAGDQAFVYYVEEQHVVQEVGVPQSVRLENARWIARTDDVRLTLITCAPYEAPGNTHRVIVVARP